jgi:hypothetical protein
MSIREQVRSRKGYVGTVIPLELLERMKAYVQEHNESNAGALMNQSDLVREAVNEYLKKRGG